MSDIYQLKITLKWSKPTIWRRILVNSDTDLATLHDIIQVTMGWQQEHLYAFNDGQEKYGWTDHDFEDGYMMLNAQDFNLDTLLKAPKDKLVYEYDFGDGWIHDIVLEKIFSLEEHPVVPKCLKAVGACPPEDCGGIGGYYGLLDTLENPKHRDYKDMRAWLGLKRGQSFDPDFVDLALINQTLKQVLDRSERYLTKHR